MMYNMKLKTKKNVVNNIETIQNNNIMSITKANQTKKKDVALEFKIVNILYTCNTAHYSLKLLKFYNRFVNVLHVLTTIKQSN